MWTVFERPKREYRKNVYPAVNINRGGMFLNRMACDEIGIGSGDVRWLVFYTDPNDKNKFGFQVFKNPQANIKNIYKVKFRETNSTAKINAKSFMVLNRLHERALKLGQTTFPITKGEDGIFSFELS